MYMKNTKFKFVKGVSKNIKQHHYSIVIACSKQQFSWYI